MKLQCLVVVVLGSVMAALADGPEDELKKLEGTWTIDSATLDGKAVKEMQAGQAMFAGHKLTLKDADGKVKQKFTCKVDPSQKPKTMNFVLDKKEKNAAPGNAIYELKGNSLKLCIGPPDKRPTEFSDKGQVLIVLKRKK